MRYFFSLTFLCPSWLRILPWAFAPRCILWSRSSSLEGSLPWSDFRSSLVPSEIDMGNLRGRRGPVSNFDQFSGLSKRSWYQERGEWIGNDLRRTWRGEKKREKTVRTETGFQSNALLYCFSACWPLQQRENSTQTKRWRRPTVKNAINVPNQLKGECLQQFLCETRMKMEMERHLSGTMRSQIGISESRRNESSLFHFKTNVLLWQRLV